MTQRRKGAEKRGDGEDAGGGVFTENQLNIAASKPARRDAI